MTTRHTVELGGQTLSWLQSGRGRAAAAAARVPAERRHVDGAARDARRTAGRSSPPTCATSASRAARRHARSTITPTMSWRCCGTSASRTRSSAGSRWAATSRSRCIAWRRSAAARWSSPTRAPRPTPRRAGQRACDCRPRRASAGRARCSRRCCPSWSARRRRPPAPCRRSSGRSTSANTAEGLVDGLEALKTRPDSRPSLAAITCPTLVIVGADDALTPPVGGRDAARPHPRRIARRPADAGHMSNLEQPVAFAQALWSFLAMIRPRPRHRRRRSPRAPPSRSRRRPAVARPVSRRPRPSIRCTGRTISSSTSTCATG